MSMRYLVRAFVVACVLVPLAGCSNSIVDSITVSPTTQALSVGQTVQFKATGVFTHRTTSSTTQDLTNQVTWTSSVPAIATVNSSGLATAISAGTTTITASTSGFTGSLSATATITVTGQGSGTGTGCERQFAGCDSKLSICFKSGPNRSIHRYWNYFFRSHCQSNQSGCLEFQQRTDCDHQFSGTRDRGWSGFVDNNSALHECQWRKHHHR